MSETNPIILAQMLMMYHNYRDNARIFTFTKNNLLRVHHETDEEASRRKSRLSESVRREAAYGIHVKLKESLKGRIGKVWIDPAMRKIAVPLQSSTGESGLDILPTGSRVPIPEGKKIRAFTYWEKVNDIDLSAFALKEDGTVEEFSWRTFVRTHGDSGIVFSGDVTNGFNGGSEYFDVELESIRLDHPDWKYLIFCDNVYTSGVNFSDCMAKGGFMSRDILDSGKVYEPATVQTSFRLTGNYSQCYMFAIDIRDREMIWLNLSRNGSHSVAGETEMDILDRYLTMTDVFNVYDLYAYAGEQVDRLEEADTVVTNCRLDNILLPKHPDIVYPWDTEKMLALMAH